MPPASFTSEERIRELSAINAEVAEMMKQAGHAVNALTNRPLATELDEEDGDEDTTNNKTQASPSERREAFTEHTTAFYVGVQSVTAKLRRNVYALEEAGIITSPEAAAAQVSILPPRLGGGGMSGQPKEEVSKITNGGMGNLDVGWLNGKGNKVGAEKENELMVEARELLEKELGQGG